MAPTQSVNVFLVGGHGHFQSATVMNGAQINACA